MEKAANITEKATGIVDNLVNSVNGWGNSLLSFAYVTIFFTILGVLICVCCIGSFMYCIIRETHKHNNPNPCYHHHSYRNVDPHPAGDEHA